MYIVRCEEMWGKDDRFFKNGESLTDVCRFLETRKISVGQVVHIANINNSDFRMTYDKAVKDERFVTIDVYLTPVFSNAGYGCRVDLL